MHRDSAWISTFHASTCTHATHGAGAGAEHQTPFPPRPPKPHPADTVLFNLNLISHGTTPPILTPTATYMFTKKRTRHDRYTAHSAQVYGWHQPRWLCRTEITALIRAQWPGSPGLLCPLLWTNFPVPVLCRPDLPVLPVAPSQPAESKRRIASSWPWHRA